MNNVKKVWIFILITVRQYPGYYMVFGHLNVVGDASKRIGLFLSQSVAGNFKNFMAQACLSDIRWLGLLLHLLVLVGEAK